MRAKEVWRERPPWRPARNLHTTSGWRRTGPGGGKLAGGAGDEHVEGGLESPCNKGRKVWGLNLYAAYKVGRRPGFPRDYGYTTAPLVWKDWLIVEVGARE